MHFIFRCNIIARLSAFDFTQADRATLWPVYINYTSGLFTMAQCKADKYLDIFDASGVGEDGCFVDHYVDEIKEASKLLFSDMCKMFGAKEPMDLLPNVLLKPSISKAQLSEWLFTTIYILDRCSIPLLSYAARDVKILKDEKIDDQKKVIELQDKLLGKKEEELQSMKTTVQSELQSYSSVLQKSCVDALEPRKIAAAVAKTVTDKEDRSGNIVVFGVPEEDNEVVETKVIEMLDHLDQKPNVKYCGRIGQRKPSTARPIKFNVQSSSTVYQILRSAKKLKEIEGYKTIYLCPDRTIEERNDRRKLVEQLKQQRLNDPNKKYYIRKGEITAV